jgi:hypothetical protein
MARYGEKAGEKVERALHEMHDGELKSGRSNKKVTSRKQAIAIGLSEAREEGGKVPEKAATKKSTASKKTATKKSSDSKESAEKKSTATKKSAAPKKTAEKKSGAKKSAAPKKAAAKKTATKTSTAKKSG